MNHEMPKPSPDHQKLHRLVGIWRGTEKMYPSEWMPDGGTADGTSKMRIGPGGFVVIGDYEQSRGGQKTFEGHSVCTWDAAKKEVVLCWWDSIGQGLEEFRGDWKGDVLTLTSKSPMGFARLTYDCSKSGELGSAMEMSKDGKTWGRMFDVTYRRAD